MPYRHFFNSDAGATEIMDGFFHLRSQKGLAGCGPWIPPADLFETQGALVARFELAGCKPKGLQLQVIGRTLHLRGFRQEYSHKDKKSYRQMEIHYGPFERTLTLPCAVQSEGVHVEYKNGMLEVALLKADKITDRVQIIEIVL